jgi:porphobilinogen synthase
MSTTLPIPNLLLSQRPRRLRQAPWIRTLVRETELCPHHLIWPLFIQEGAAKVTPIDGLPGVERLSIDMAVDAAREARSLGLQAVALFPVTPAELKTPMGDEAFNPQNLMARAIRAIKKAVPEIGIIADVALDPYTSHGHDGLLDERGDVDNDATVAALCRQARVLAEAGCDMVAPSDMMDGRVGRIRAALDEAGHTRTIILSYTAKYASALYGPFREAVGSKQQLGRADKRTYQMQPTNAREALREASLDVEEGADIIMVKPATLYLDIIRALADAQSVPVFAYHVSGEYAMVKAAAAAQMLEEMPVMLESLVAIRRAGATAILTYAARDVARWLQEGT